MTGGEFLRRLKRHADENGIAFRFVPARGDGSHGTVYFGDRMTVVKDRKKELGKGLLRAMCRQLGVAPEEI